MGSAAALAKIPRRRFTAEEYLVIERAAEYKSQYFRGEIFAMAGATAAHNLISLNAAAELRNQLRSGGCRTYASDMRVMAKDGKAFFYPDVVVVCEAAKFYDKLKDTLLNPAIVVEVLSRGTRRFDLTVKLAAYQKFDSIREILLIAQDKVWIEHHYRTSKAKWEKQLYTELSQTLTLAAENCAIAVVDIYDGANLSK
jgi:Uma2 family endonuclease